MAETLERIVAAGPDRLRPYPAYKDSGVQWLGEIPEHWEVRRLKHLASLNPNSLGEETDPALEIVYVDIGGVDTLGNIVKRESLLFGAAPSRARRLVRAGDVIVSTVRTYLRAIAPIANPEPNLVVSTGFAVVRPWDGLISEYAAYALRAPYFVERVVANSKGVSFPAINESEMATFELAVPPRQDQRAIAVFLDRETAKIDALVAKKERLLQLLHERRTALITQAVTKGLDPKVPMKDSGVEWLGEIPAHWEVKRLKHVALVENSGAYGREAGDAAVDVPVCTTAHITADGHLLNQDMPLRAFSTGEVGRYEGKPGDLFVVKSSGSNTNIISGKLALVTNETPRLVFSNFLMRIRASSKTMWPPFLAYLLRSELTRERIRRMVATTTYPNINVPEYIGSALAVPPKSEQNDIAAYLDKETAETDALIAKIRGAIERVGELRTALISAAVTGKIDVR